MVKAPLFHIGRVRRALFLPFPCKWNAWVRYRTADLELLAPRLIG